MRQTTPYPSIRNNRGILMREDSPQSRKVRRGRIATEDTEVTEQKARQPAAVSIPLSLIISSSPFLHFRDLRDLCAFVVNPRGLRAATNLDILHAVITRLMHDWEKRLSRRDTNRTTLPFEWGFEFLNHGFVPGDQPKESLQRFNETAIHESDRFFGLSPFHDFRLEERLLSFPSAVESPYEVNNTAYAEFFPSASHKHAVLVLPQWNANERSHVGLCKLLNKLGISALRLTLPYHEMRNPSGPRADFMVSPNVGRTIQAIQQSVQDARRAADWLQLQGYETLGIMGSSVGSCISYLTFVHEPRFRVGVFNHVSSFFGDVVWNGISTRHVRRGLEPFVTQQELRDFWRIISPNSFVRKVQTKPARRTLFISARYDLTFPPDLAQLLFEEHGRWEIPYDVAFLPCGHYTSSISPFKFLDGYLIASYFRKHLRKH